MKNYKEVADSVFERREQHEALKRRKRKILFRTLTPICCVCLIAFSGVGLLKSGIFTHGIPASPSESISSGTDSKNPQSDNTSSDNGKNSSQPESGNNEYDNVSGSQASSFDIGGVVDYNGRWYTQKDPAREECVVVRDKKIGTGNDFEGTYNYECLKNLYEEHGFEYSSEYYIESEIYTVKDNPDLLCVVLSNGVFIVLEAE